MTQLFITKGQTALFNIAVIRNGVPVDLTSAEMEFEAKRSPGAPTATIFKSIGDGITVTDALGGLAQLAILDTDTEDLTALDALLFWKLTLKISGNPDEILDDGTVSISIDTTPNLYITVEDVRAEGLLDPPFTDSQILAAIKTWQQFIERACRQWFYPLELELSVDGTDSDSLHFGVPIITISELRINYDKTALDPSYYKVYSAMEYPKDKQNPRIKLIDTRSGDVDIYTAPMRDGKMIFRKGRQNQFIHGVFGCIEPDGQPPAMIKRALLKLVIEKLARPLYTASGSSGVTPPPLISGVVLEEWSDGHKIKYGQAGGELKPRAPGLAGITNDPEILGILKLYKAPIGVATPANPSYT